MSESEDLRNSLIQSCIIILDNALTDLRENGRGYKLDSNQAVFKPLDPARYKEVEELVSANSRIVPSVTRFRALCGILSLGFKCAYNPPIDFDLAKRNWLAACLEMMRENPLVSPLNDWKITLTIPDTQLIMQGFSKAIGNMIKWADAVRQTEPLADLEEWGGLVEAIYRTFVFGREVVEDGQAMVKITDEVLLRQNHNGNLNVDDRNINSILSVCESLEALAKYKSMQPPSQKIIEIDIANCGIEFNHEYVCTLADGALRTCHQDLKERLITHEDTDDVSIRKAVLSFTSGQSKWFDYYVKEYCNPSLWHLNKASSEEVNEFDLPVNFEIMDKFSKAMCELLIEDTNGSKASLKLLEEWNEIRGIFATRCIGRSLPTFSEQKDFCFKLTKFMQHYYDVASLIGCRDDASIEETAPGLITLEKVYELLSAQSDILGGLEDKISLIAQQRGVQENNKLNQHRTKGVCPYRGNEVHPKIEVYPGERVIVCNKAYYFTGGAQWKIVTRFLTSIKNGDNNEVEHFPVPFTTKDYNKCKMDCQALIDDWIERQPAAVRIRNTKYAKRARFKIEKLR